ncbi:hypothetical protein MKP08_08270 [Erythrobacter sp. LQ02-29]|uniref:hypothetical protein n=1 Tax=Erythrobacter sp. LQ02-29 TaxID=2920384 RepID=UPI001F4F0432|nr:hypothetical protein [Erythrobacter sp. LQ02-29]MCP9222738.1 hypothetical protein [Erythrobacter sp. LQ02-29]
MKSAVSGALGRVHHFAQAIEGATTPPPRAGWLACSAAKVDRFPFLGQAGECDGLPGAAFFDEFEHERVLQSG